MGFRFYMSHGECSKKNALRDIPTIAPKIAWSGTWNGWFIGKRDKELCPNCFAEKMNAIRKLIS